MSAPSHDADAASVHERLDDLTRQLERLSRVTAGKIRPPGAAADAVARDPLPDEDSDPHDRLDRRLDQFAAEGRTATDEVARYAGDRMLNRSPLRPVYSDTGLDQTLAEIAARQRALDGAGRGFEQRRADVHRSMTPPSQNLSGLEDTLRKITSQIESLRRPCPVEDAVPALRQELTDISRSLAEAVPRQALEAIEAEVRSLAERLDQSRQSGVDGSALANLEQGLTEVRDALQSLKPAESLVGFQNAIQGLSGKIDGIVASQQDPVVLQQLESAITGLRGIVAHVASDDTLARLTEEVRGIAVRLEHTAGSATAAPDSLTNLERQIGAIAEAIDQSNAQGRQAPAKIETMVRELAEKIEKQQLSRGDTIAFGQLEERIAKLVEKLDASGSRFNHLEAIERGLTDVLVHLEEQRGRSGAATPTPSVDPVVESLKRDLDTVNGTLNRVVDRLATIETGIRGGGRPTPATAPAASVAKAPILPANSAVAVTPAKALAPPSERLAAAAQAQRPAAPRERPPIDPNLPPDHPLEPGAAHARTSQSAADRIAASEAALEPTKPPVIPDPGGKTNFIAAARHAAQAASRLPNEPGTTDDSDAADDPASTSLRRRLTGRVRSMLVGASVFILAVGAARVMMTLLDPFPPDTPGTQQAVQAPAILPAPKSTARIMPDPTVTGSTLKGEHPPRDAAGQPSINPLPGDPAAGTARKIPAAEQPAAGQDETQVTGSIPAKIAAPDAPAAVPLPPTRPDAKGRAEPKSRLAAAAAAGDPAAAYELAVRYIDGRGVRRSYEDAAQWLTRASKQGLAPAQFRLGSLYEKGLGVKKDLNEARRQYAAAAAKGNAKAMHNLAVLQAEGGIGKPDYKAALQWFRKAADRGVADSQYNLGVLYARGVGGEQNLAESYKWFALAARQGDKEAVSKRDEVAARLDAESLMAARLALKTWAMEPQPAEATTVRTPPGGWDEAIPPMSAKRRPRAGAPLKLGPG